MLTLAPAIANHVLYFWAWSLRTHTYLCTCNLWCRHCVKKGYDQFTEVSCIPSKSLLQPSKTALLITGSLRFPYTCTCMWLKVPKLLKYAIHKRYPFHGNANTMIAKVSTVHVQWCPTYLNIEYPNGNCFIHSSLCSHVWSHAALLYEFVWKF